jgi:uncharacterized protein YcbK (DUF882 family)
MSYVAQHFTRSEFACKCGCGLDSIDAVLVESLQAIRDHFGTPITITSGIRCCDHNKAVGGADYSQHLLGRAADIRVEDVEPRVIADFAEDLGMSVGRYNTFTHIDSRSGMPDHWDYSE